MPSSIFGSEALVCHLLWGNSCYQRISNSGELGIHTLEVSIPIQPLIQAWHCLSGHFSQSLPTLSVKAPLPLVPREINSPGSSCPLLSLSFVLSTVMPPSYPGAPRFPCLPIPLTKDLFSPGVLGVVALQTCQRPFARYEHSPCLFVAVTYFCSFN